ncbi:PLDc_N domain-containing protein [Arthrobacter crusticola]|uniref:PLDc_N domain-containing protein n=1 Tax=Arthrobacter crusticola TaxID=2547960 RepID=A0A4V3AM40_9MICC|nr:PLD nuclease N-terminal domain-containing protein [Arthrobacter crusticola]TDK25489.1 PLDc_N domain-containing protein [Arthrobacter crusticola]
MPRLLLFLVLLGVAVIVYALIECAMTRSSEVRSISKPAWLITILVVPLIGAGLWFLFGRPRPTRGTRPPRPAPRQPTAPDDDPQFLQNLETRRRQQAREQELKRKEEELKAREAQSKGGGKIGGTTTPAAGTPAGGAPAGGTPSNGTGDPAPATDPDDDADETGSTGAHRPNNP